MLIGVSDFITDQPPILGLDDRAVFLNATAVCSGNVRGVFASALDHRNRELYGRVIERDDNDREQIAAQMVVMR